MKLVIEIEVEDHLQEQIFENTVWSQRDTKEVRKYYTDDLIKETCKALDDHYDSSGTFRHIVAIHEEFNDGLTNCVGNGITIRIINE